MGRRKTRKGSIASEILDEDIGIYRSFPNGMSSDISLLEDYKFSPWLRGPIDKISSAMGMAEWRIYKNPNGPIKTDYTTFRKSIDTTNMKPEQNSDFLRMWDRGNDIYSGFTLRKLMAEYNEISGDYYIILDFDKDTGLPVYFTPIPPAWIKEKNRDDKMVLIESGRLHADQKLIPEGSIIHMCTNPDPADPLRKSIPFAQCLAPEVQMDLEAAKYAKEYFINGMMPSGVIVAPGATKPQLLRMKKSWQRTNSGRGNRHGTEFIGTDIQYIRTEQEFNPDNIVKIREFQRNIILQILGIPPEVMGNLESSNKATIKKAEEIFARWVIIPRLMALRSELQKKIINRFWPGYYLDFVPPMPEDRELTALQQKNNPASYTHNEVRAVSRHTPWSKEEGGFERNARLDIRGKVDTNQHGKLTDDKSDVKAPETPAEKFLRTGDRSIIKSCMLPSDIYKSVYGEVKHGNLVSIASKSEAIILASLKKSRLIKDSPDAAMKRAELCLKRYEWWSILDGAEEKAVGIVEDLKGIKIDELRKGVANGGEDSANKSKDVAEFYLEVKRIKRKIEIEHDQICKDYYQTLLGELFSV